MNKERMDSVKMDVRQKKRLYLLISWAAVLLWMAVIFISSAQPAQVSGANRKGIVVKLVQAAERTKLIEPGKSTDPNLMGLLDHYFRKCTHGVVYFILGALTLHALYRSGRTGKKQYLLSFFFCVLYAASDEFHQLFVPGRGGQVQDVLIDSTGAALGLCVLWGITRKRKTKSRRK